MKKHIQLIAFLLMPIFANAETHQPRAYSDVPFGLWILEFKKEAIAQGIPEQLLEMALNDLSPNERVVELDRKQPEGTKTFTDYLEGAVNQTRINKGRELLAENRTLLENVARDFGVQPRFIVALWGIETNYGGYTGNFSIIESLATLAYEGRRAEFFRKELLKAFTILKEGHITLDEMLGSWAGAMGQSQFMPSSFLNYAVDYDGDGKKDIWNSLPDVFASIANYLKSEGWSNQLTWGRQVMVPESIADTLLDGKHYKPIEAWRQLGVTNADGSALPDAPYEAALSKGGERSEPLFLVYRNYDVLLHWNKSRYFATAVGKLSDAIE